MWVEVHQFNLSLWTAICARSGTPEGNPVAGLNMTAFLMPVGTTFWMAHANQIAVLTGTELLSYSTQLQDCLRIFHTRQKQQSTKWGKLERTGYSALPSLPRLMRRAVNMCVAGVLLFYFIFRLARWYGSSFIGISVSSPCMLMWIGLYCRHCQFIVSVRVQPAHCPPTLFDYECETRRPTRRLGNRPSDWLDRCFDTSRTLSLFCGLRSSDVTWRRERTDVWSHVLSAGSVRRK